MNSMLAKSELFGFVGFFLFRSLCKQYLICSHYVAVAQVVGRSCVALLHVLGELRVIVAELGSGYCFEYRYCVYFEVFTFVKYAIAL